MSGVTERRRDGVVEWWKGRLMDEWRGCTGGGVGVQELH